MAKAAKFSTFDMDLRLATAGIAPDQIARQLARFARSERDNLIINRQASPIYDTFVNARKDVPEEDVILPGPIVYVFSYWQPIIAAALAFLYKRSPVGPGRKGHYRDNHIVMVGGQVVSPTAEISADEEVMIVNTQPYSRKIEVGFMNMTVPRGVYQDARRNLLGQFGGSGGAFDIRFRMVTLPNGYVLKGVFRQGKRKFSRTKLRADVAAGQPMTYPALVMRMK